MHIKLLLRERLRRLLLLLLHVLTNGHDQASARKAAMRHPDQRRAQYPLITVTATVIVWSGVGSRHG